MAAAVLDDRGAVLRWTGTASDLTGFAAEEVCGRPVQELVAGLPGELRSVADWPTSGQVRLRRRSGDTVDVTFRISAVEAATEFLVLAAPADDVAAHEHGAALLRALSLQHRITIALHDTELATLQTNAIPDTPDGGHVQPGTRLYDVLCAEDAEELEAVLLHVLETGAPVVRREQHVTWRHDPARRRALSLSAFRLEDARGRPTGVAALYIDPLHARGLTLGAISVWRCGRSGQFTEDEADLMTQIASRGALAIDNARRYTREHRAAVALQQRLLPPATTETPAAQTAGVYRPAGGGAEISGDWYDAIALPSLRLALVAGDVVGHGMAASATMGRLRATIQTLADIELEPDELLTRIADLVQRLAAEAPPGDHDIVGATCLYAVYDPVTRRCAMASAGHPPSVLVRPDGTTEPIGISPGPPLALSGMPYETTTIDLEPASVLALYTDGLVEHGEAGSDEGLRRLTDMLAAMCRPDRALDETGRTLLADLVDAEPRDDATLLLARTHAVPVEDIAHWEIPADPAAVSKARGWTARQLTTWGLDDLLFTTEVIVSELVTNAIRHGRAPAELRLIRHNVLVCEVTDSSSTQPRMRRTQTTDEGGRGLFLVAQLAGRWGCRHGLNRKTIWSEQSIERSC
ncbi:SpoIIE family protein phosphatase [Streptomyces sp. NPDC001480]|uniref:ATP-binding SpoIIE family protein phosphatase n=1 Tax=Streptomyces sp. NPDC001480 TaxID=3364577 RepID=UPI003673BE10